MSEQDVLTLFPWMEQLGFTNIVNELLSRDITDPGAILSEIRRSERHREMFPNLIRLDGTLRMNERDFLDRMDDYRTVLRNAGVDASTYSVSQLSEFLVPDIDPNELADRFTIYNDLRRSGRHVRDAFYVYAGIRLSDDELYEYVVDDNARLEFDEQYARRVTIDPPDYDTFIQRATEAGLDRVADSLRELEENGIAVADAASEIRRLDPTFTRQLADLIFTGGTGEGTLGLDELTSAVELALIGGAASSQGLALPTLERIEEIRQAGVTRSQALQSYGAFASQRALLQGQVQRLNVGRRTFTQADFEEAVFLQDAEEADLLARAAAREASLSKAAGTISFSQDRQGRLVQAGFRSPLT